MSADASRPSGKGTGISLLLRLPKRGESIETIAGAHRSLIKAYGSVWLGVLGKRYSDKTIEQIQRNPEFLYLIQRISLGLRVYKGKISDVRAVLPRREHHLVPAYYDDLHIVDKAKLWVRLSSLKLDMEEVIEGLQVVRSGKNASVLLTGLAYLAMVERKPSVTSQE